MPTLSVFQSFSPVHTKKLNNGNMIISLTGHVLYDVRDHVLKISVFVRLDKNDNWAFSKIPILGTVFIKLRFWFPCGLRLGRSKKSIRMRVDRALIILTTRTNQFRDLTGHDHRNAIVRPMGKVVVRFI